MEAFCRGAQRMTNFGEKLRKTSLDELPELFNILTGDMSFIGPRPLLTKYLPYYNEFESRRHHVRPGLTGLAQVNGRNLLSWEDRFRYDVDYVDNITFMGDLRILLKTFKNVIQKSGVVSQKDSNYEIDFDLVRISQQSGINNDGGFVEEGNR